MKMDEPERSQALSNMEELGSIPTQSGEYPMTIHMAVGHHADWTKTPEKEEYWMKIYCKYRYEK